MIRLCMVAAVLLVASGCAQMRATVDEYEQGRQVAGLIGYAQDVAAMRPESQRDALIDARRTYARDQTPYARVRLALLLSLPGTAFADDAGAEALLEPLAGPGAEGAGTDTLRRFGGWLHAQIAERSREQRKAARLKEQLDTELTREHKRSAQLREQLDALRAIERTLIDRGQGGAR
jgi:hypothetical protein